MSHFSADKNSTVSHHHHPHGAAPESFFFFADGADAEPVGLAGGEGVEDQVAVLGGGFGGLPGAFLGWVAGVDLDFVDTGAGDGVGVDFDAALACAVLDQDVLRCGRDTVVGVAVGRLADVETAAFQFGRVFARKKFHMVGQLHKEIGHAGLGCIFCRHLSAVPCLRGLVGGNEGISSLCQLSVAERSAAGVGKIRVAGEGGQDDPGFGDQVHIGQAGEIDDETHGRTPQSKNGGFDHEGNFVFRDTAIAWSDGGTGICGCQYDFMLGSTDHYAVTPWISSGPIRTFLPASDAQAGASGWVFAASETRFAAFESRFAANQILDAVF